MTTNAESEMNGRLSPYNVKFTMDFRPRSDSYLGSLHRTTDAAHAQVDLPTFNDGESSVAYADRVWPLVLDGVELLRVHGT